MRTPNDEKKYYYIHSWGEINETKATNHYFDIKNFENNNFFNTKDEAQEALKKIKELLLSLKK